LHAESLTWRIPDIETDSRADYYALVQFDNWIPLEAQSCTENHGSRNNQL
jgi:hypothetical protein